MRTRRAELRTPRASIVVLTGPSRAGKTTVCRAVLEHAAARGIRAAGVLTEDDTAPDGSRLQIVRDLATGERRLLARARSAGQPARLARRPRAASKAAAPPRAGPSTGRAWHSAREPSGMP